MKIVSGKAPFVRGKRTTRQIMRELLIGLAVIFLAAVIYNFTLGVRYGLKTIGIMTVSILFTLISDIIAGSLRYKKAKDGKFDEYMINFIRSNFSIVTAVIFALTVPVGTPVYVVILGSMFATLIAKHAFGGFGSNVFNPAAMGRIFLALAFGGQLKPYLSGGENLGGLKAGVTVTSQFVTDGTKFLTGSLGNTNVSMLDLYLGKYNGALGETFTLLILVVGIVLAIREVINWRTPVFLFVTVALSSIFISLVAGVNVLDYLLVQFGLGGMVFGAVFMFTDPVTSPTSNYGKALIGIIGGLLNVLIRVAGIYPEGTAFSIALVNVFSPMIDRLITGRTTEKIWVPYTVSGAMILCSIGLLTGVSAAKLAPKTDDGGSSELPPVVEAFVKYSGSFTSVAPNDYADPFTTNVEVGLSDSYHIVSVEYDVIANPETWGATVNGIDSVIAYYTSLSVAEFKELTSPAINAGATAEGQTGEHIIPGAIYSSHALYEAMNDALKDLDVYSAALEDYPYDSGGYDDTKLTMDVDVYVDKTKDIIKVVDIKSGASTDTYAARWEGAREDVLAAYHDLDIATFLSYTDIAEMYGEDAASYAGVSFSTRRLFNVVQAALEGYGA